MANNRCFCTKNNSNTGHIEIQASSRADLRTSKIDYCMKTQVVLIGANPKLSDLTISNINQSISAIGAELRNSGRYSR